MSQNHKIPFEQHYESTADWENSESRDVLIPSNKDISNNNNLVENLENVEKQNLNGGK
jgi:hypothetical protein